MTAILNPKTCEAYVRKVPIVCDGKGLKINFQFKVTTYVDRRMEKNNDKNLYQFF